MPIPYDRIKSSFVQQMESLGLVSLDPGRHKQLTDAVDALADSIRKFLSEEQPEVVAQKPTADPAASADDAAAWLSEIELPKGWKFWQIPSTAHGAGRSVFAHYDNVTQSPVAGVAHVKLISPKNELIDLRFKPDDGKEDLEQLIADAITLYETPEQEPVNEANKQAEWLKKNAR